ncbi:hypothetical protein N2152v2_001042 [Parachlorella kessleri]
MWKTSGTLEAFAGADFGIKDGKNAVVRSDLDVAPGQFGSNAWDDDFNTRALVIAEGSDGRAYQRTVTRSVVKFVLDNSKGLNLFSKRHYGGDPWDGDSITLLPGNHPRMPAAKYDNWASSATISPGCTATLYENTNYRGRKLVVKAKMPSFGTFDNKASSVKLAPKLFSFGLISDVQHADIPDGFSFHGVPRYYRQALAGLERALEHFQQEQVSFAVHLGDIIDYHNSVTPPDEGSDISKSEQALQNVLQRFERLQLPVLHMLGNHCLYNHPRDELNRRLGIDKFKQYPSLPHSYYTYSPHPGWRFVVCDGYDVSLLGWPPGHPLHARAASILSEKNPNKEKNSNNGLVGVDRRFVKFGGGLSEQQLAWLGQQLEEARSSSQQVVVLCHLCFHPRTCAGACLMWNYDEVLQTLHSYDDVVVATLAGHAHMDGYFQDEHGIHHRVCKAVLETPPGRDCFGVVDVFPDRLVVRGVDTFSSGEWCIGGGQVVRRRQLEQKRRGTLAQQQHP